MEGIMYVSIFRSSGRSGGYVSRAIIQIIWTWNKHLQLIIRQSSLSNLSSFLTEFLEAIYIATRPWEFCFPRYQPGCKYNMYVFITYPNYHSMASGIPFDFIENLSLFIESFLENH